MPFILNLTDAIQQLRCGNTSSFIRTWSRTPPHTPHIDLEVDRHCWCLQDQWPMETLGSMLSLRDNGSRFCSFRPPPSLGQCHRRLLRFPFHASQRLLWHHQN
mmetsp:Transcript_52486/g.122466  ORF Transcript_52486/g.122466 Transcript_52486/m.122466 type:complete len:103 (-) Transcript_52486:628-936(-)